MMNLTRILVFITVVLHLSSSFASPQQQKNKPVIYWQQGDSYYAYDGVFYSFINSSGQGVKLWTPPGSEPIRGVIVFGNPGGGFGGDTRGKTTQRDVLEFAVQHNFAVAGITGFPAIETYPKLAKIFLDVFSAWARHGENPELRFVPFIFSGGSNAGIFAFSMMAYTPQRTIAITPNCGPVYHGDITKNLTDIPAWMHVGVKDPFLPQGVVLTEQLFEQYASGDHLWVWDAEMKGHENGSSDHVDFAYWDAIIPLRLPQQASINTPVQLKAVDYKKGWWVDHESWDHSIARVGNWHSMPVTDESGRYGWMPNEAMARVYQATASRQRIIKIQFENTQKIVGGKSSGVFLSAGGNVVAKPGENIRIGIDVGDLAGFVKSVDIYNLDEKIGQLNIEKQGYFEFKVDKDKRIYVLHARAKTEGLNFRQGKARHLSLHVSNPLQAVIVNPERSKSIDEQLEKVSFLSRFKTNSMTSKQLTRLKSPVVKVNQLPDHTIGAIKINKKQVDSIKLDTKASPVWAEVKSMYGSINIDARHLPTGSRDEGNTKTPKIKVNALYGSEGLFLFFEIEDKNCRDGASLSLCGMVDMHLASIGLPYLLSQESSAENYSYGVIYSLLNNALQFKLPVRSDDQNVYDLDIHNWDLWSFNNVHASSADNYQNLGIWVDKLLTDKGSALEVFLPWALLGNPGLASVPPPGTSISSVIGYRSYKTNKKVNWPFGLDPWAVPAFNANSGEKQKTIYGQIVFLESVL